MKRIHPSRAPARSALACAALLALAATARGQVAPPAAAASATQLPPVTVQGNYDNAVGSSDAASQGSVTAKLIGNRPTLRPAEVLEFVPGVIVTQHSGDGKANQYFLRGFNLDHGTDFATYVSGMPVNMPTHAHGHGYSDLNWLLPELVNRIAYKKGPYFAEEGDFSSAGAARIGLFDKLPQGIGSLTLGENGYRRALVANSNALRTGDLLYALEYAHNDGPWENPEKFHRVNGVLRYSLDEGGTRQSITAMGYDASWNSTDQIPQRAVDAGLIGRFGTVDASDGGFTSRYSLSYEMERALGNGAFKFNAYAIQSRLRLYSNFTYFLERPIDLDPNEIDGDQFEQAERRKVFGLATSRSWNTQLAGRDSTNTIGLQVRHDRLDPVGLYSTVARQRAETTQESTVRQTSVGLYAENATQWTPWFRSVAGLRGDRYDFDVKSSISANSGERNASIASPKLSLIFGPWAKTEYFVNYGYGFHSNDARGTVATVAAKDPTGPTISPVDPLVRSKGGELGLRTEIVPGLQSSLSVWALKLDSELLFVGDAGETEPSRASRRYGVEWNNHYVANKWLLLDADLAFSKSRFTEPDPGDPALGDRIPGAIQTVASFGATVTDLGPWFGQFQLRYFGPRALDENNENRSKATTLAYLRGGYKISQNVKVMVDVFNLFDRKGSDIDYYYASRLKGEPAEGVNDIHFHPVEPRSVRVSLVANF
ncbi:MAG: TonB-dependent receptor [Rhizobiales bacterium]|nr:TonB-dependent receptor [Rhizobacter sp.]